MNNRQNVFNLCSVMMLYNETEIHAHEILVCFINILLVLKKTMKKTRNPFTW